jgi:hypothetical protein
MLEGGIREHFRIINESCPQWASATTKCSLHFFITLLRLQVTANVVPISPILVTLRTETLRSFEMYLLTRATLRNIPEDGILHSHRLENLKSDIALTG